MPVTRAWADTVKRLLAAGALPCPAARKKSGRGPRTNPPLCPRCKERPRHAVAPRKGKTALVGRYWAYCVLCHREAAKERTRRLAAAKRTQC